MATRTEIHDALAEAIHHSLAVSNCLDTLVSAAQASESEGMESQARQARRELGRMTSHIEAYGAIYKEESRS